MTSQGSTDHTLKHMEAVVYDSILWVTQHEGHPPPPLAYDFLRQDDRDKRFSRVGDVFSGLTEIEEATRAEKVCAYLCAALDRVAGHVARLDAAFSEMLEFHIINPIDPVNDIAKQACYLLRKLPANPCYTHSDPDRQALLNLPDGFFLSSVKKLHNLKAGNFVSRNLIATSIYATLKFPERANPRIAIQPFLNMIMELFEATLRLRERKSSPQEAKAKLLVLSAFLWETWHSILNIHRWGHLGSYLYHGVSFAQSPFLDIRGHDILVRCTAPRSWEHDVPPYMCRWAFELIRSDRANVQANFRPLLDAFAHSFGHLPPRCVEQSEGVFTQCDGRSPLGCMRFTGARIRDQSAHASPCPGRCRRLYWDERSYRNVVGSRAVKLDLVGAKLKYCVASERTMAVTHVWSHGQGGRIDGTAGTVGFGFNLCLHRRFCAIAQSLGCDSYWMDTPCIPEDHTLRREAIEGINSVFSNGKVTLVCDRDLMLVDVSLHNVHAYERLVSALLVCDWNIRAWTFLEATKGANNICVLCRDNNVVRLSDVIRSVHEKGDLSLANLCLSASHLLRKSRGGFNGSLETIGAMLNHRHASRPGDEIVIWSLLLSSKYRERPVCTTAEEFWTHLNQVNTAFLVSEVPRLAVKGLTWAPQRPDFPIDQDFAGPDRAFAYEGEGSALARIHIDVLSSNRSNFTGIRATWLVCCIDDLDRGKCVRSVLVVWITALLYVLNLPRLLRTIPQRSKADLQALERRYDYYFMMCLLSARTRRELSRIADSTARPGISVALLRPKQRSHDLPYDHRGFPGAIPLVVVTSVDAEFWSWKGVIRWDQAVPLPPFVRRDMNIE